MSNKPIVMFGVGESAEVAAYYFESDTQRRIAAFTIDGAHLQEASFLGRPVVPIRERGAGVQAGRIRSVRRGRLFASECLALGEMRGGACPWLRACRLRALARQRGEERRHWLERLLSRTQYGAAPSCVSATA